MRSRLAYTPIFQNRRYCYLKMLVVLGLMICCCQAQAGIIIKPTINPEDLLGTLSVTSSPSGADVFIDSSNAGQTPLSKSLAIGTYSITVSKTGYVEQSRQVEIKSRSTTTASFQLITSIATGILSLDSTPSGATIFIDNVAKGTTPVTVQNFRVGTYTITLKKTGYQDITEMVNVVAGQTTTFSPVLKPLAATGTISVNSIPSGAYVYLDGTTKGQTPVTIPQVSAGSHTLRLTKSGYNEYSAPVTINAGQTLPLTITLTQSGPVPDPNPPTTGSISVSSDPTGAKVALDGESRGTTPVTLSGVKVGDHTVKITLSGYSDYSAALSVVGGEESPIKATLIKSLPNSTKGSVSIASIPAGAQVLLRGQDRGKTPVTVTDLEAGDYPIVLNLEGYNSWPGTISVTSGQTTSITIRLTPINNNTPPTGAGSLIVTSSPSGAKVYLNGDLKGTTPLTLQNVNAGFQKLLFTLNGYSDTEEIVEVKSGGTETVAVTMKGGKSIPGFSGMFGGFAVLICTIFWKRKFCEMKIK